MNRRKFLAAGASVPLLGSAASGIASGKGRYSSTKARVNFTNELVPHSPQESLAMLAALIGERADVEGMYLGGGAVAELEARVATIFGKEDAILLPTGTLANSIAVRILCGERRRAVVQHDSHLFMDEGDAAATLAGIALFPLSPGEVALSPEQVARTIDESAEKHASPVGAISIESPVRRHDNAAVPFETLRAIRETASHHNVGMHWDGARALLQLGTPGFDLAATSALFDTIAVSLYKYLEAPWGGVLAGSRDIIDRARAFRHSYGGELFQGWHTAIPALNTLKTFERDIRAAHVAMNQFLSGLERIPGFEIDRVPNGTDISFLDIAPDRAAGLKDRLEAADIAIRNPKNGRLLLTLNLSILRRDTNALVRAFAG